MARQEDDREDLLREATALVERVEIACDGRSPIVAGFRRDGSSSFFLDSEIVYHFNSRCQLRRAFLCGRLYKAEDGRLVELTRHRIEREVQLLRHDLTPLESAQLLCEARRRLEDLYLTLTEGRSQVLGEVPPDSAVADHVRNWLARLPNPIEVAPSPRVS